MIAMTIYVLCFSLSAGVAGLLWRNYQRGRVRLLFWSTICFAGLALGNLMLFADVVVFSRGPDLSVGRLLPPLFGYSALIYGFVRDVR